MESHYPLHLHCSGSWKGTVTAEMSCCDTPEKPLASENQYISTSLKVVAPKNKLQVRGRQQKTEAINFFPDLHSTVKEFVNLMFNISSEAELEILIFREKIKVITLLSLPSPLQLFLKYTVHFSGDQMNL